MPATERLILRVARLETRFVVERPECKGARTDTSQTGPRPPIISWRSRNGVNMPKQNTVFKDAYNRCLRLLVVGQSLPSEPELCNLLGVSRTTVRSILSQMVEAGLIEWNKRSKAVQRSPSKSDFFPEHETSSLSEVIERTFMKRILMGGAEPGMQINELELAREIGVGTTSVREFLIRFSRFGLIEKRPNSHWVLKGFTRQFAEELIDVREMFELKSAAAFINLPVENSAWNELETLRRAHVEVLAEIDSRYLEFSELDDRLHRLIQQASGNRFIVDFYDIIAIVFHYHYQWNKANARERNGKAILEHLDYIEALKTRRPEAVEAACRLHLSSARLSLMQSLSPAALGATDMSQ